jgi:putative ABC transport system permease protein
VSGLRLSWAALRAQPLAHGLAVLLLALGVAVIVVVLLLRAQLEARMVGDTRGIDLVVGAKGSPLQLVLSAVYQIDVPAGNISLAEARRLARHPLVGSSVPMALGDAVAGFRIVGTTHEYVGWYGGRVEEGRLWRSPSRR